MLSFASLPLFPSESSFQMKDQCLTLCKIQVADAATWGVLKEKGLIQGSETQVFSGEFCKISKNILFTEHVWATASQVT